MSVLPGDEKRLARSQPAARAPGVRWMAGRMAVALTAPPASRDGCTVHQRRDRQRQRQVHRIISANRLDRLAGLVERGVGDADQVRGSRSRRPARSSWSGSGTARSARNDSPQRLRQDHQAQARPRDSRAPGRLGLALRNAGCRADDLGDEGCGQIESPRNSAVNPARRFAALESKPPSTGHREPGRPRRTTPTDHGSTANKPTLGQKMAGHGPARLWIARPAPHRSAATKRRPASRRRPARVGLGHGRLRPRWLR